MPSLLTTQIPDYKESILYSPSTVFLYLEELSGVIATNYVRNPSGMPDIQPITISSVYGSSAIKPLPSNTDPVLDHKNPFGTYAGAILPGGSNSFIKLFDNTFLPGVGINESFAFCTWFANKANLGNQKVIVAADDGSKFQLVKNTAGGVSLTFNGTTYNSTALSFNDKEWHWIGVTFDKSAGVITVMVDGINVIAQSVIPVVFNFGNVYIGNTSTGSIASGSACMFAYPAFFTKLVHIEELKSFYFNNLVPGFVKVSSFGVAGVLPEKLQSGTNIVLSVINDKVVIDAIYPPSIITSIGASVGSGITVTGPVSGAVTIGLATGGAASVYKTQVDAGDMVPNYLDAKIFAASTKIDVTTDAAPPSYPTGARGIYVDVNMTALVNDPAFNAAVVNIVNSPGTNTAAYKVKVTAIDAVPSYLGSKIVSDGSLNITTINSGGDEKVQIVLSPGIGFAPLVFDPAWGYAYVPYADMPPQVQRNVWESSNTLVYEIGLGTLVATTSSRQLSKAQNGDLFIQRYNTTGGYVTYVLINSSNVNNTSSWETIRTFINPSDNKQLPAINSSSTNLPLGQLLVANGGGTFIQSVAPSSINQLLSWSGSNWSPSSTLSGLTLTSPILNSATLNSPILPDHTVPLTALQSGGATSTDALVYNGTYWVPSGGVQQISNLTSTTITTSNLNVTTTFTTANGIVNLPSINSGGASIGQVLNWNGTSWVADSISNISGMAHMRYTRAGNEANWTNDEAAGTAIAPYDGAALSDLNILNGFIIPSAGLYMFKCMAESLTGTYGTTRITLSVMLWAAGHGIGTDLERVVRQGSQYDGAYAIRPEPSATQIVVRYCAAGDVLGFLFLPVGVATASGQYIRAISITKVG